MRPLHLPTPLQQGKLEEAVRRYQDILKVHAFLPDVCYNLALCYYELKQYDQSLKHLGFIIENGIKEHPELGVGVVTEGMEARLVANSEMLRDTHLVEAFNLKAAIEYRLKNQRAAREALTDMPPRQDSDLDQVTLHNQAIVQLENDAAGSFEKLSFLLMQETHPPTTFANLLLLYLKFEYYNMAGDLVAEHPQLAVQHLSPFLRDFVEALMLRATTPEEAYGRLDDLANKQVDALRKLTKSIQEARQGNESDAVKFKLIHQFDETLER